MTEPATSKLLQVAPTLGASLGRLSIVGGHLAVQTGTCTCDGPFEAVPGVDHRDGCGLEPLATVEEVRALLAAEARVFFTGDTVPAKTYIANISRRGDAVLVLDLDWVVDETGPYVEIAALSPEEWQATVGRARTEGDNQ